MQPTRNPYLCVIIVGAFSAALFVGLVGVIALAFVGKEAPNSLVAIVSGAAGSLGTFLVTPPRGSHGVDFQATGASATKTGPTAEGITAQRTTGP